MRSSAKVASILATIVLAAAAASAPGCSNQGEGEVCNLLAGNGGSDDCQSGLECSSTLNTTVVQDPNVGRCCLPLVARSKSTVAICQQSQSSVTLDASVPADPDGSTTPTTDAASTPDAGSTTDADSTADTGTADAGDAGDGG